jgi:low affinity Fe/Cu permease
VTRGPDDHSADGATHRRARLDQPGLGRTEKHSWDFHHSRSSHLLHRLGSWSAKAEAGIVVAALLIAWVVVGAAFGFPRWWEVVLYSTTSAVTLVMVFALQHMQRREQVVIQRKLDELLRAQPDADDRMIAAEAADDSELVELVEMGPDDPRTEALGRALDEKEGLDSR